MVESGGAGGLAAFACLGAGEFFLGARDQACEHIRPTPTVGGAQPVECFVDPLVDCGLQIFFHWLNPLCELHEGQWAIGVDYGRRFGPDIQKKNMRRAIRP
jgi:hypothetical protein